MSIQSRLGALGFTGGGGGAHSLEDFDEFGSMMESRAIAAAATKRARSDSVLPMAKATPPPVARVNTPSPTSIPSTVALSPVLVRPQSPAEQELQTLKAEHARLDRALRKSQDETGSLKFEVAKKQQALTAAEQEKRDLVAKMELMQKQFAAFAVQAKNEKDEAIRQARREALAASGGATISFAK